MKRTALALLAIASLAVGVVTAADKPGSPATAKKTVATTDQKTMAAEEKDRLAREKKEMEERAALLKKQLETHKQLVLEKDAYLKQLQEEIQKLKAGK